MRKTKNIPESVAIQLSMMRNHPFDPPAALAELRQEELLHRLVYPDGHIGWLVTSHKVIRTILSDPRFSARAELLRTPIGTDPIYGRSAPPGFFIFMDAPDHTRYRRLLSGYFTASRTKDFQLRIEEIITLQLELMAQSGPPADLWNMLNPVPALVKCELLGILSRYRSEYQRNHGVLSDLDTTVHEKDAARQRILHFFGQLTREKRSQPSDDLLSNLAASSELTDEEIGGIGALLMAGGHETTASMLVLGAFALMCHPEQLERLRTDPSLIDNTIEELLRYLTIFQIGPMRTAFEDVELENVLIKMGETVTLSLPAANRDPERFPDPDKLDVTHDARGHLAFGFGLHQCIGQYLARMEMKVGFLALLQRFPTLRLAVLSEEVPMRTDKTTYGVYQLPVTW